MNELGDMGDWNPPFWASGSRAQDNYTTALHPLIQSVLHSPPSVKADGSLLYSPTDHIPACLCINLSALFQQTEGLWCPPAISCFSDLNTSRCRGRECHPNCSIVDYPSLIFTSDSFISFHLYTLRSELDHGVYSINWRVF